MTEAVDVLVIGAGPAGAVAAALARQRGWSVRVLEKTRFPRFSIGESLLPQSLVLLEEAGMLAAVAAAGFQYKSGAQIARCDRHVDFEFSLRTCRGYDYAYQVTRADFDQVLAREAARQGAEVWFEREIRSVRFDAEGADVEDLDANGRVTRHRARFVLDASGFGRTLPRLLGLDRPANFPVRASLFAHVEDRLVAEEFDRTKIRVGIHPVRDDVWYWLIPLAGGRSSVGVVAEQALLDARPGGDDAKLWQLIAEEPGMARLLRHARPLWPARAIRGYASSVSKLYGERFALLGNAGEFLDPVFSSGVTIAMKSASLAVPLVDRVLRGEPVDREVDWEAGFAQALLLGVETFRGYVETWYEGVLPTVMFSREQPPRLHQMMCSVLAGYAWDRENPYVGQSGRRLRSLARLIHSRGLDALPRPAFGAA